MGKQIWFDLIELDYSVVVFPVRHSLLFMFHWGLAPEGPWSQQLYLPLGQPSSPKGLYMLCLSVFPLSGICFLKNTEGVDKIVETRPCKGFLHYYNFLTVTKLGLISVKAAFVSYKIGLKIRTLTYFFSKQLKRWWLLKPIRFRKLWHRKTASKRGKDREMAGINLI